MGCNCGGTRTAAKGFVVKLPGQPEKIVATEAAASQLVRGVPGASYRPKR